MGTVMPHFPTDLFISAANRKRRTQRGEHIYLCVLVHSNVCFHRSIHPSYWKTHPPTRLNICCGSLSHCCFPLGYLYLIGLDCFDTLHPRMDCYHPEEQLKNQLLYLTSSLFTTPAMGGGHDICWSLAVLCILYSTAHIQHQTIVGPRRHSALFWIGR